MDNSRCFEWLYGEEEKYQEELDGLIYLRESEADYEHYEEKIRFTQEQLVGVKQSILRLENSEKTGYSPNWKTFSRLTRIERGWKCDRCKINLSDYGELLHIHHKNRIRNDNKGNNLETLCILCHAQCDGHNHIMIGIDDEVVRVIVSKRQSMHKELINKGFDLDVFIENKEHDHILRKYGLWLQALANGDILPLTESQNHFVSVFQKGVKPETTYENAWQSYLHQISNKARPTQIIPCDSLPDNGIVFHVDASGKHGLEAQSADESSVATWDQAKQLAEAHGQDWHLPSKDELTLLYEQRIVVGGFTDSLYWSSTETSNRDAGCQSFLSGHQVVSFKFNLLRVRAIRAF
ncbi:MAG: DUF413 domain-containing protein [Methylococcaceae bacterium]